MGAGGLISKYQLRVRASTYEFEGNKFSFHSTHSTQAFGCTTQWKLLLSKTSIIQFDSQFPTTLFLDILTTSDTLYPPLLYTHSSHTLASKALHSTFPWLTHPFMNLVIVPLHWTQIFTWRVYPRGHLSEVIDNLIKLLLSLSTHPPSTNFPGEQRLACFTWYVSRARPMASSS